jgi:hypothetical protein
MCGQSLKLGHFADSIAEDEARAAACLRRYSKIITTDGIWTMITKKIR